MSSKNLTRPVILLFLLGAGFAACGGADSPAKPTGPRNAAPKAATSTGASEAKALFDSLCFTCHGANGHGDGPGAGALNPKPRSFADAAWQDSVTDEHISKVIVYGGAAVGKSPMMVGQPQLKGQTEALAALVKIVREFRGK